MIAEFWVWLGLGICLIALEAVVPGTFLLWPGIAAVLTGLLSYMVPDWGWQDHALVFAGLTVAAAVAGRRFYGWLRTVPDDGILLNQRGRSLIGEVHTLETPILDGVGRLRIGDSTWKIRGPELPAGTRVRVTAVDGIVLQVDVEKE